MKVRRETTGYKPFEDVAAQAVDFGRVSGTNLHKMNLG